MVNRNFRMNRYKLVCAGVSILLVSPHIIFAQRDTTKPQTIDITSSYKPVLRNTVKINLSPSQLPADTASPVLQYTIPSQNLFYAYQPISLKPLALQQDTNLYLGNRRYLKAGFGSYTTPYAKVGLSFGDGKTSLVNLTGSYISSKGNDIKYQDFTNLNISALGSYFGRANEFYGGISYSADDYYLYGYDHALFDFKKEDLRQQFQDIKLTAGFKNTRTNGAGINYNPNVELNFFTNRNKLSETNVRIQVPLDKKFGESFAFEIDAIADLTNYATKDIQPNNVSLSNNVIQVSPSLVYNSPRIKFNGGLTPVWTEGELELLPNIYAEAQLQEKVFMLHGGWVGRYIKNNYRNLSKVNPYLAPMLSQLNTKEVEYYGGIKASIGKHFNFNAKAGLVNYTNLALFINDTASDEKAFVVTNEPTVNNFRIHGDLGFISQDKFSLTAGLTLNGYTGLRVNNKAWHTLPMEFTSSMRWYAMKKLLIKGDFYMFGGPKYVTKSNTTRTLDGGTDLSVGAEYKINKQFSAWLDANNVFNNKYQRWHNYEVYGLNLVGGIIIHF